MNKKFAAGQTTRKIGMGKIPFQLRQKALISKTVETMRPGGYMLTRRAVDVCGFSPGDSILDAGCGYGMTLSYLADRHRLTPTGLDCDRTALDRVAARTNSRLIHGCLPELPLATNSFKGIFCECVLSLLASPQAALAECQRVLAPNGYLILSDLYLRKWLPSYERVPCPDTCARGAAPLMQMMTWIEGAGFNIHIIEDHSGLLCQLGQMPVRNPGSTAKIGYAMIIAQK